MIMNVGTRCLGSQLEDLNQYLGKSRGITSKFPSANQEIAFLINFYSILEGFQTSVFAQDPKILQEITLEILNGFIALMEKDSAKTAELYSSYIAEHIQFAAS